MHKPNWRIAPKWANWLAMDDDGEWWWYESEPEYDTYDGNWISSNCDQNIGDVSRVKFCGDNYSMCDVYASESLEQRP